jgi:hypothetical protein
MSLRGAGGVLVGAVLAALLTGCAEVPTNGCPKAGQRATAELIFGRSSDDPAHPLVTEAEFSKFLNDEATPRFPDGLTVIDAQGRWRAPAGTAIREPSEMVMIVLPGHADDRQKLDALRDVYKRRYHQQSVLLMTHGDCVSF